MTMEFMAYLIPIKSEVEKPKALQLNFELTFLIKPL